MTKALTVKQVKTLGEQSFEKVYNLFKNEHTMEIICTIVANGGSVTTLASTWGVEYGDIMNYIHMREDLERRYRQATNDRSDWTIETLLKELRAIALCDIRKLFTDTGQLLPPNEWPEDVAKAVSAVETFEVEKDGIKIGDTQKIKFWDKTKAIEMIGKNLALFVDRVRVDHVMTLEQLVAGSNNDK